MKTLLEKTRCIGFTGTRRGMTDKQKDGIAACLAFTFLPGSEFHHGDCIGADEEAAAIANDIGYIIVAHPGFGMGKDQGSIMRAYSKHNDRVLMPETYTSRNQHIVDVADELYAAPHEATEQLRSGTWSTIRKARKKRIYVGVVGPNGEAL